MKVKLIAMALLLATVFGLFGCTAAVAPDAEDAAVAEKPSFISGGNAGTLNDGVSDSALGERPENLMNLAQPSAENPAVSDFQIVYPAKGVTQALIDEAFAFATDIRDVTGTTVNVVEHLKPQKDYEIILQTGSSITRSEILPITDAFSPQMSDNNFLIKTIGTRLVIYGKTEQAITAALLFLRGTLAYRNSETKEYGVAADVEFLYKPVEHPPVTVVSADDPNYFEFYLENFNLVNTFVRLSFTGNHGWRLQTKVSAEAEYNDMGAGQRLSYSLGEPDPSVLEEIEVAGPVDGIYVLTASDGSYVYVNTNEGAFRLEFYTASGKLAASVNNITTDAGGSVITGDFLDEDDVKEAVYGTGERFNKTNQRGFYIDMFSKDIWSQASACYMVIPLLSFSRGSGIFINQYEPMTMDLGKENKDKWKTVVTGVPLDVYFFTTEKIADVLTGYSELTGYAGMPEEWTYGMIVCAYGPDLSQKWTANITPSEDGRGEGIYEMIANMEKYDLPWTGVLAEAWGPYSSAKHDDLKELCDYVHSFGKKFLVYMAVASVGSGMTYDKDLTTRKVGAFQSDYYLYQKTATGKSHMLPQTVSGNNNPDAGDGSRVYLDITNPEAVNWYFDEYWTYLANDIGVDGCKIDFCEQIPENYKLYYYDKSMPTNGSHHWLPSAFCAMYWDMISSKPDSGMCYTRGGGIGAQRAPYMWAGDQARGYKSLEFQLTSVLSSGISGVPYMSYDMSGYQYGSYSRDIAYESQVFIRGTQFSAYTICLQTHGKVRRSYQFANENEDYLYVTELYRAYTKLHEHLTPYLTELCEEACTTGMPVMRHLILGWQDDVNVYNIEDEYTFGDAFLIAPILNDGYSRKIYLPEGTWKDLNTGEIYEVGAEGLTLKNYQASIAELPTFYNMNTESEIAPTLVEGIMELYDYARSVAPEN